MAINPNIALSVRGIELQNPLNALAQYSQIQGLQNQNAMAQLQMREAEAAAQEKNMLRRLDPTAADYESQLFKVSPQLGIAFRKEQAATEASKAATSSSLATAAKAKQTLLGQALRDISGRPSDANITAHTEDIQASSLFSPEEKAKALVTQQTLLSIPFEQRQAYLASQGATPSELKPTLTSQDFGGGKRVISTPAFGGMATLVPGSEIAKTQTFADITAAKQAATSAGQLGLAQQRFAWEKANPGFELKEAEDGSIVAVNKRTLQAVPVTIGGVAGTGMPGERAPALDGTLTGTPLRGKGTAMSESQSNATAYGMRMKEANAILEDLAKKGVLKGALIEGIPLVGESLGKVLPSVLGGTSEAQQQVNQAKSNFITAVLRKESGAVISDSEFDREDRKYFPQVNDSPAVIKQKENARKLAIKAIEVQAGPGAKSIQQLQPSAGGGVDTSNPLLR
jgi:hypothetical protein